MALVFNWNKIVCFGSSKHPYRTKRKKGTFTLHEQAVLIETVVRVIEVHGIRMKAGKREGYIRFDGKMIRVIQTGKHGWCKK